MIRHNNNNDDDDDDDDTDDDYNENDDDDGGDVGGGDVRRLAARGSSQRVCVHRHQSIGSSLIVNSGDQLGSESEERRNS